MIKIINGAFGHLENGRVIPKTSKDEPFSCPKKVEERLVSIGVAKYVKTQESVEAQKTPLVKVQEATPKKTTIDRQTLISEYKSLNLPGNPIKISNAELQKAIDEKKAEIAKASVTDTKNDNPENNSKKDESDNGNNENQDKTSGDDETGNDEDESDNENGENQDETSNDDGSTPPNFDSVDGVG